MLKRLSQNAVARNFWVVGVRSLGSVVKPNIDRAKLQVTRAQTLKPKPDVQTLAFGTTFTDHMLVVEWDVEGGWGTPKIQPYGPMLFEPSVSSLHYGLQGFEGLKAYKDKEGRVRMFRPLSNMARFNRTATRLGLPNFDGEQLVECMKELLRIEKDWVPQQLGYSLYIRPTIISTHAALGVATPRKAMIFVILSPVGPYYKSGFKAISLLADPHFVRAWPGGTGDVKCGGNYAMTIAPQRAAEARGFSQLLWLFGSEQTVTEVGTMNQFFFWINEQGEKELITAPLGGLILAGVTRDSILSLTRGWGEFMVSERTFTIHDIIHASNEGRIIEAFGAGTAALVCPVKNIHYSGKDYKIPLDPKNPAIEAGPLTQRIQKELTAIQYGNVEHEWSVVVD